MTLSLQSGAQSVDFTLDLAGKRLLVGARAFPLTRKGFALVGILTLARILEHQGGRSGWVTCGEVAALPEWSADRLSSSLHAQIRREIKRLRNVDLDIIDSRLGAHLKGPFRLKHFPTGNWKDLDLLAASFTLGEEPSPQTAAALFQWLEAAEPVWRAAHFFDKPEYVLADSLDLPIPQQQDPIIAAIALVNRARRLRDLGDYQGAKGAISSALAVAGKIQDNSYVRVYLEASSHLQQAWLDYRWRRLTNAEQGVAAALATLGGEAHLKVRGQILSLRSILRRLQLRYDDALRDLQLAGECWLVEGDLYNLFSVYHNLSTLVAEQASHETSIDRRHVLLKQAIEYCKKSDTYCRRYHVGQNSIVSILQLVSLYTLLEDFPNAKLYAERGYKEALKKENLTEAAKAHGHRVRLLLWKKDFREAETIQSKFLSRLGEHPLRALIEKRYGEMLRQARGEPGCLPTATGLD